MAMASFPYVWTGATSGTDRHTIKLCPGQRQTFGVPEWITYQDLMPCINGLDYTLPLAMQSIYWCVQLETMNQMFLKPDHATT